MMNDDIHDEERHDDDDEYSLEDGDNDAVNLVDDDETDGRR